MNHEVTDIFLFITIPHYLEQNLAYSWCLINILNEGIKEIILVLSHPIVTAFEWYTVDILNLDWRESG